MSAAEWSQRLSPLDDLLRSAGARMHLERGAMLPADFGSSTSELAVCMRAVGIGVLDEDEAGPTLAIVGPRAEELVRAARPTLVGVPATLLREEPGYYLAVAPRAQALEVWHALVAAGAGMGLGYVGTTALHNFLVQAHLHARQLHD